MFTELDEKVMMMNRKKKKNILNINAVEIVEAGCFEVHALHTFFFYHSTIFQYFSETP